MMSYTSLNVGGGHKAMSREKKKFVVATTVGSIVALIGIIMATSANFVFDLILRTEMVLKPSSANFPFWSDLPMPIQTSMFIFNVTNADNFSAGLDKPKLEEVGPYVFNEYHKKVISWLNPRLIDSWLNQLAKSTNLSALPLLSLCELLVVMF